MVRYAGWHPPTGGAKALAQSPWPPTLAGFLGGLIGSAVFGLGAIPAAVFGWRQVRDRQVRALVQPLRDLPPREAQFAAILNVSFGTVRYGSDEGLVSFVDDMLLFEGRRTQFSLPRSNASTTDFRAGRLSFYYAPRNPHWAELIFLERNEAQVEFTSWLREPTTALGTSIFPPLTPSQGVKDAVDLGRRLSAATSVLGGIAFLIGLPAGFDLTVLGGALALGGLVGWTRFEWLRRRLRTIEAHAAPLLDNSAKG